MLNRLGSLPDDFRSPYLSVLSKVYGQCQQYLLGIQSTGSGVAGVASGEDGSTGCAGEVVSVRVGSVGEAGYSLVADVVGELGEVLGKASRVGGDDGDLSVFAGFKSVRGVFREVLGEEKRAYVSALGSLSVEGLLGSVRDSGWSDIEAAFGFGEEEPESEEASGEGASDGLGEVAAGYSQPSRDAFREAMLRRMKEAEDLPEDEDESEEADLGSVEDMYDGSDDDYYEDDGVIEEPEEEELEEEYDEYDGEIEEEYDEDDGEIEEEYVEDDGEIEEEPEDSEEEVEEYDEDDGEIEDESEEEEEPEEEYDEDDGEIGEEEDEEDDGEIEEEYDEDDGEIEEEFDEDDGEIEEEYDEDDGEIEEEYDEDDGEIEEEDEEEEDDFFDDGEIEDDEEPVKPSPTRNHNGAPQKEFDFSSPAAGNRVSSFTQSSRDRVQAASSRFAAQRGGLQGQSPFTQQGQPVEVDRRAGLQSYENITNGYSHEGVRGVDGFGVDDALVNAASKFLNGFKRFFLGS